MVEKRETKTFFIKDGMRDAMQTKGKSLWKRFHRRQIERRPLEESFSSRVWSGARMREQIGWFHLLENLAFWNAKKKENF